MNINNFGPFLSDVWGTVSDWAMVAVTGTTLYYINKTFKSQYEVQKLQQQSTNIENEKFRIGVLPFFELTIVKTDFEFINDDVQIKILAGIHLIKNESLNLKIELNEFISNIIFSYKEDNSLYNNLNYLSENAHRTLNITALINKTDFEKNGCIFTIVFNYTDIVENKYTMGFGCYITYTDTEVNSNGPYRVLSK
jgi:hypothetical protein